MDGKYKALLVVNQWCWMVEFKDWIARTGRKRFPVPTNVFDEWALDFGRSGDGRTRGNRYIWVVNHSVSAMHYSFTVDHPKRDLSSATHEYKRVWDRHIAKYNREAQPPARGAIHLSKLWVDAESLVELLLSAAITMIILLALALAGMLVFTRSIVLSVFVVLATIAVIEGLTFFIIVVMKWGVGLIEVIAVVYFIGYAVTYSLHIAHTYAHHEALDEELDIGRARVILAHEHQDVRLKRTVHSLKSIGGAALGSSITTAGASLPLIWCTLTIFRKLGSMCLVVTVLSIIAALCPLPASLLVCGPINPGQCSLPEDAPAEREKKTERVE